MSAVMPGIVENAAIRVDVTVSVNQRHRRLAKTHMMENDSHQRNGGAFSITRLRCTAVQPICADIFMSGDQT